jgi:hypothetical protein
VSYYLIGIGGTGAKCVESFIHLCAAGLMPDNRSLFSMFVDPDGSNGSLKRAGQLLQNYYDCKQLQLGASDLFKNDLRIARPDVWSPLQDKPQELGKFFNYDTLHQSAAAHLFDVLYSHKERETSLKYGFRGHPAIGAAVMAAAVKLGGEQPWATLRDQISLDVRAGQGAKVILFGSIFGGTGASGVPTIGRLVSNEFSSRLQGGFKLGSVLMLPYFSFDPVKSERMRVDADTFLLSTQTALDYYYRQDELKVCDAVYLLGNETLKPMRHSSIGGQEQENEPHLLEVYAALAATHFLANDNVRGYPHIARELRDRTGWPDLPYDQGFAQLKQKLNQLAKFAFAYLTSYHPMLKSINNSGAGYRAPWYVNLFKRKGVDLKASMENELKQLKSYCESYLLWLANIEQSQTGDDIAAGGHLINFKAFAETSIDENGKPTVQLKDHNRFNREAFGNLLLPVTKEYPRALSEVWERMSNARVRDTNASGVGRFVRALYDSCGKVTTDNF